MEAKLEEGTVSSKVLVCVSPVLRMTHIYVGHQTFRYKLELAAKVFGQNAEMALGLVKSLAHLLAQPLGLTINTLEVLVNLSEALVNLPEPLVYLPEPLVYLLEALVNLSESLVDLSEPLINLLKAPVDPTESFIKVLNEFLIHDASSAGEGYAA